MPSLSNTCLSAAVGPVELRPTRWPLYGFVVMSGLALIAMLYSGLFWWLKILALPGCFWLVRVEWQRAARISALRFTPEVVEFYLADGRALAALPPFQCLVTPSWVAVRVPGVSTEGWLSVFAGQLSEEHFRHLRRVLWLHRR